MALTAYYDDSGTDAASPVTVIGGPVMSERAFVEFEEKWSLLLESYEIPPPLHMKDFYQKGKHGGLSTDIKMELFGKAAGIINEFKLFSLSISVPQQVFNSVLPKEVRKKLIGPYALAFFCAVLANRDFLNASKLYGNRTISYLVDHGTKERWQLLAAWDAVKEASISQGGSRNTGSIAFDTDARISALQAADVVAWSARRRSVNGQLEREFAPLGKVLDESPSGSHCHVSIPLEGIERFSKPIMNWIYLKGKMPSLGEIITWS